MKQYKIKNGVLCCLLTFVILFSGTVFAKDTEVYVGGMPFGVRFHAGEVSVLRVNTFSSAGEDVSPAADSGIRVGDIIQSVNSCGVSSVQDVTAALDPENGTAVELTLLRGEKKISTQIIPKKSDETGKFQLGILLKDSSAGIGTVTYIQPESLQFAGLGHGICNTENGALLRIDDGYICNVKINGIHKGVPGAPGELRGNLETKRCGKMIRNCEVGVFGVYEDARMPSESLTSVASGDEVCKGDATILCTLDDNVKKEYKIKILEVDHSQATKNYVVKITDPRLLKKTGGIVQGMSGSPILQNGKLVGAITHVCVNL